MATLKYFKNQEFATWLANKKDTNGQPFYVRPKQIAGYIGSVYNHVLKKLNLTIIIDDLPLCLESKNYCDKGLTGLMKLSSFLKDLAAIADAGNPKTKQYIAGFNTTVNSLKAWASSGLDNYVEFLNEQIANGVIQKKNNGYKVSNLNAAIRGLSNICSEHASINGISSLIQVFNSENGGQGFLKYLLSYCYFFNTSDVKKRFIDVLSLINSGKVYARHSENDEIQKENEFNYTDETNQHTETINFVEDKDGNYEVRKLIETTTHYTIGSGANSNFQNYIISHIWGNAFDPRYFTNLWNLVLVPAWGNFLLDKVSSDNKLTLQIINTFKAICLKQYKMKDLEWSEISMVFKNLQPDPYYVVHDTYTIKVFSRLNGNTQFSKVKEVKITI